MSAILVSSISCTARVFVTIRQWWEPAGRSPITCPETRLPPPLQREDSGQLREEGGLTAPHLHRNTRQLWQIVGKQLSPAPAFEFSTENKSAARLAGTSARRCLRGRSARTWVANRSRSQGWRNLLVYGWQRYHAATVGTLILDNRAEYRRMIQWKPSVLML